MCSRLSPPQEGDPEQDFGFDGGSLDVRNKFKYVENSLDKWKILLLAKSPDNWNAPAFSA